MALKFTTSYLEDSQAIFRFYKLLGDKAMEQLTEEQLFMDLGGESNSITIIVKHIAGNMRSRWTGFPAADDDILHGGRGIIDDADDLRRADHRGIAGDWIARTGMILLFGQRGFVD